MRITPVHNSEICKSELRRSDRRAAMCVENISFKTKKLRMQILFGKSQIALMQVKSNSTHCWGAKATRPSGEVNSSSRGF